MTRRILLTSSVGAAVLLSACGGAALPDDPANAVAEGLTALTEAGFAWELTLDTEANPDAPQEANAFVVAARGLELAGVATPEDGASVAVGYPGAGSMDAITLLDGDDATSYLRVQVPALDPALFDEAFVEVELEDLTPEQEADAKLLLRVARDVTSGWVAVEGDLAELVEDGDAARITDPFGEDRDELVAMLEEQLAAMPDAPEVDVDAVLTDVEATFGSDWAGFAERFLVLTETSADAETRTVDVALLARDATLALLDVVDRNVPIPADEQQEWDATRAEVAAFPEQVGGVSATLSDRYVTSMTFDLQAFLASIGVTETDTGPLPAFAATMAFDDIGEPQLPEAPSDLVATYDAQELVDAVERLQELAMADAAGVQGA